MKGCVGNIAKYTLFVFNILILIVGLVFFGFGLYGVFNAPSEAQPLAIAVSVIGGFTLVLSFLGCCGAMTESPCQLVTYSVVLCIFMIISIALASLAVVEMKKDDISLKAEDLEVKRSIFKAFAIILFSIAAIEFVANFFSCYIVWNRNRRENFVS